MLTAEQIQASYKANLETLFGLTTKAFEGVEKLVELNLTATKAALSEVAEGTKAAVAAKDIQELLTLQASMVQPMAEKAAAYSRHLYDIASASGAEFTRAVESKTQEGQKKFQEMMSNAMRNAPAGSESAVAIMQGAVAAASNALESVQKAVKQATEVAETNFKTMTDNASKAMANSSTVHQAKKAR